MAIDKLEDAAKKAAYDVAEFITQDMRASATQHGWDKDSVQKTSIVYTGDSYDLSIEPDAKHKVMNLEYGTEILRPTAVFRKYSNNTAKAEAFFVKSMEAELGVKL